jgi:hypothetical protein
MQLRVEAYNAFNHTQFSNTNLGLKPVWDRSGTQTASDFGKVNSARDSRILQLALRLSF